MRTHSSRRDPLPTARFFCERLQALNGSGQSIAAVFLLIPLKTGKGPDQERGNRRRAKEPEGATATRSNFRRSRHAEDSTRLA